MLDDSFYILIINNSEPTIDLETIEGAYGWFHYGLGACLSQPLHAAAQFYSALFFSRHI